MQECIRLAIKDDYVLSFMSNAALAEKYGVHRKTIKECLKSQGIPLRKRTPKTLVNHLFFSEYNAESCYWAGFILADGYIRNNKRFSLEIKLQKQDVGHLNKFSNSIGFSGLIKERSNYFSITISSSQLIFDLADKFEIYNKKSLTCHISSKIPNGYLKDYIRGYFDGDGCITHTSIEAINFTGTDATLNFIRDYFYNTCNIKLRTKDKPDIVRTHTKKVGTIHYSGMSAFRCLHHMYNGTTAFLERKYRKYMDLMSKYQHCVG